MKKILVITYYWPPAGGPGVQRWLKFVKYFSEFGIEPIVYVPENPTYPIIDSEIESEVSSEIKIIKHSITEPYKVASWFSKGKSNKMSAGILPRKKASWLETILLWIRGNCFIPDARVFWVRPSVQFLSKYIVENQIDTIITTGPPHSVHLIGKGLKQKNANLKWIADFRDPWTNIGYHSALKLTKKSIKKHLQLEKEVLQKADKIVVTSFSTAQEFSLKTSKTIEVITNGYDDFQIVSRKLSSKFQLSHIGSLLTERNPKMLWKVLGDLVCENANFANDLELCLAGEISQEVITSIEENNLLKYTKLLGYISHKNAIELQQTSQILLLLEINHPKTQGIIPGKLFEYMVSNRPILAMGYHTWDAAEIIKKTNTGYVVNSEDYSEIKSLLLNIYDKYVKQELKVYPIGVSQYHRKELTRKMAEIIS